MKNLFLAVASLFILSAGAQAQTKSKSKSKARQSSVTAPATVKTKFTTDYADAKPSWKKTYRGNYIASFTNAEGLNESAEYTNDGDLVVTRIKYNNDAAPEIVKTSLDNTFTITEIVKNTRPEIAPYYQIKVKTPEGKAKQFFMSEEGSITE